MVGPPTAAPPVLPATVHRRSPMRILAKTTLTIASAAVLLSLAAGTSAARTRIEISTTATLASGILTFQGSDNIQIICDVTLHATLRRLIDKIHQTVIGLITSILTANLRSNVGVPRACTVLPHMELKYGNILGSLPNNITGILLLIATRFLIEVEVLLMRAACLYEGLISALGTLTRGVLARLEPSFGNSVSLLRDLLGNGACARTSELRGAVTLRPSLTVRLLEA
jgi:hypothetical protein